MKNLKKKQQISSNDFPIQFETPAWIYSSIQFYHSFWLPNRQDVSYDVHNGHEKG